MKKSKLFRNIVSGFGGQFIAITLGIFVPYFFITSYGSDINGLMSTITQIFTYLALLEAGIGQAARNMLYKPFQEKDIDAISQVSFIASTYFKKFTVFYGIGVVILSFVLPIILKTNVDASTIVIIVLLEGMSGVISFCFVQTPSIILSVDGKNYVNNNISLVNKIIGYIIKIVMASLGLNIILLQIVYFIITVTKVIIYQLYFRKHYKWIDLKRSASNDPNLKLRDRNAYIITEVCWTVFSSTDMIVLSVFLNTKISSVYAIYNMIFANINLLVNAVFASVTYMIGYAYHDNIEKYKQVHDSFNSLFLGVLTIMMSVCYCLTLPFVALYTREVSDINYIYPLLPMMFCMIQILSWSRYTSGQLTGIAGYAKQTSRVSFIEAVLNITLSVIFVRKFGIIGVTFATVISLPLKVIWCTYIADKKVMKRSCWSSISIFGINYLFFFGVVFLWQLFKPEINTYFQFILWGGMLLVIFGIVGLGLNFMVNKNCWKFVRRYILKR